MKINQNVAAWIPELNNAGINVYAYTGRDSHLLSALLVGAPGENRMTLHLATAHPCPKCHAPASKPCMRVVALGRTVPVSEVHPARFVAYRRAWQAEVKASQERIARIVRERENIKRAELRKQLREEMRMNNA